MFNNMFYYYPQMADRLYFAELSGERDKPAEETASILLGQVLVKGPFYQDDGFATELSNRYRKMLNIFYPLCVAFLVSLICIAIGAELPESSKIGNFLSNIGITLLLPGIIGWIVIIATLFMLRSYKKKMYRRYLDGYTPRCVDFPDDFRDELAKCGFNTLNNRTQIEQGRRYVYISAFEDYDSENAVTMLKCICISCKSEMNCTEISEFHNDSAICPVCGAVSVLPDFDDMLSDEITEALNKYWCGD